MSTIFILILTILWAGFYFIARRLSRHSQTRSARLTLATEFIAATGLLALLTVGFFWQLLLTSNSWMPAGGGDLAPFLYPNYRFAAEHLRQGDIPLWNPHLYSGVPFAADIQSGLFYPINLITFLLVPNLTYEWLEYLAIFHFWLAGATMYICLRLLIPARTKNKSQNRFTLLGQPIGPVAAFAGAVAFQFSDLFIVHFGNLNMIAVAAWLPLVFLLFHRSLLQRSLGFAAASGAVLAIATLAGHIQITLFILLTLGLYALWTAIINYQLHSPEQSGTGFKIRNAVQPFIALLITLLVTIGLSALLLLPAYEMSQYTPRAELPYQEAAQYSLHPAQMVGLLVPNYFGRDPAMHWGPWERVETGYIGIMTLILAVIGALLFPGRLKYFFIGLGVISLLLAMGGTGILHGWLYAAAPGFNQLRAPARFILLLDFCLAMLAAFGLAVLIQFPWSDTTKAHLQSITKTFTWILGGLIIVAGPLSFFALLVTQDRNPAIFNRAIGAASSVATFTIFAIAALVVLNLITRQRLHGIWAGIAVIALITLDLFTLGHNVDVGHSNPTASFDHPEALAFLQNDPNWFRIEVTTDVWHAWQPNTAMLNGLYDVWGLYNPLTLADTTLYWSGAPPRSTGRYNFLSPKYIIAGKGGAPADGNIVPIFDADPQVNIYLNQDALARVLFVGQSRVVANHDAAWEAIRAENFNPATTVILEGGQQVDTQPESELALLEYSPEQVTVAATTNQPGYLVLADAHYPGWQATVDGNPVPIERANYAFRAVYVPAGEHTVQFVFTPGIWKVGLVVSGVTLLTLLVWAMWRRKSPKSTQ